MTPCPRASQTAHLFRVRRGHAIIAPCPTQPTRPPPSPCNRHIDRWARGQPHSEDVAAQAAAAKRAVREVVERLSSAGAVDDVRFAELRSRRLLRTGHSPRAAAAHLSARGVPAEVAQAALPAAGTSELDSAVAYARRRRIGPFRAEASADEAELQRRELGALARAGFGREAAQLALAMTREDAEAALARLRQA
jgi:regulatory protein